MLPFSILQLQTERNYEGSQVTSMASHSLSVLPSSACIIPGYVLSKAWLCKCSVKEGSVEWSSPG